MGRSELAQERARQAVEFGRQSTNPVDLLYALSSSASDGMMSRDPDMALAASVEGMALAQAHGLDSFFDEFALPLAWANAHFGDAERHIAVMREIIGRMMVDGRRLAAATALLRLAHVLKVAGAYTDAFDTVEQFLTDFPDQVLIRPSGLELRGQLYVLLGQADTADRDFREAISSARKIGTKPPELRAATSLARMLRTRGEAVAARELLEPLYDAFTEGFDTADLREAKQCLDEL